MRRILLGLALTLAAPPAWAQTRDASVAQCQGNDPDISIAGCTALIQSGREPPAVLAAVYYNRGRAEVAKGLNDQAITDLTKAIALEPNNPIPYFTRGSAYYIKNLPDPAIADLTKAIALKPDFADSYYSRGAVYYDKNLYDQAIADLTKAIALKPDIPEAYATRGAAYESKGLKNQAVADYRATLKFDPNNKVAQDGLKRLGATP